MPLSNEAKKRFTDTESVIAALNREAERLKVEEGESTEPAPFSPGWLHGFFCDGESCEHPVHKAE